MFTGVTLWGMSCDNEFGGASVQYYKSKNIYSSIPSKTKFKTDRFHFDLGINPKQLHVFKTGDSELKGTVSTRYVEKRKWYSLDSDIMNYDGQSGGFTKHASIPEFVPGKGIPTIILSHLFLMKSRGIKFGELKRLVTHINNKESSFYFSTHHQIYSELVLSAKEGRTNIKTNPKLFDKVAKLIAKDFHQTKSGRYINAVLMLSGHHIEKLNVKQIKLGVYQKIGEHSKLPTNIIHNGEFLYRLNFDLEFNLSPMK